MMQTSFWIYLFFDKRIDIDIDFFFFQIKCQHICIQIQYKDWSMYYEHMYS